MTPTLPGKLRRAGNRRCVATTHQREHRQKGSTPTPEHPGQIHLTCSQAFSSLTPNERNNGHICTINPRS
ncbi:hypothetical protein HMPREF0290_0146 [Corynebacterium efficiens YS-314]|nr:hypothetical protein HMPREF0290_0146 [Corynebacterium efficiens YS-314]